MSKSSKRKIVIILVLVSCTLIGFISGRFLRSDVKCEKAKCDSVYPSEKVEVKSDRLEIYHEQDRRFIYTKGIDEIKYDGRELIYYDDVFDAVDKLKLGLKKVDTYKDGGSIMYKGKDISLLACNTLEGNRDVFIGDGQLQYEENFCKNEDRYFVQTFDVLNVAVSNEEKYLYVTLRRFTGEEVKTFRILRELEPSIEAGNAYEFTFKYTAVSIADESMEEIFKSALLTKVEKTDKVGLDQVNDIIETVEK
ncbi:MAG TPA: hypothetical protein DCY94_05385 [Firmicutes bacterium]|nr:hypothetical protein [Bacillota bacterium]